MTDRFYVYILANVRWQRRPLLYVGITNDITRRVAEHRLRSAGFTGRYAITTLVHLEWTVDVRAAIAREKQIKGWTHAKKVALIECGNAAWRDLHPETRN